MEGAVEALSPPLESQLLMLIGSIYYQHHHNVISGWPVCCFLGNLRFPGPKTFRWRPQLREDSDYCELLMFSDACVFARGLANLEAMPS